MKKRLFAAGIICLLLLLCCLWGSRTVSGVGLALEQQLDAVQAFASAGRWPQAADAARQAHALLRQKQTALCRFVPFELVAQLDESLCVLPGMALQRDAALFAETERARSKLRALTVLFFRPL